MTIANQKNESLINLYNVIPHLMRNRYLNTISLLLSCCLVFSIAYPSFSQTPDETIKIGFLIRDKADLAVQQAAALAIEQANAEGGYHGKKFELITKSCDGPWGVGSKQAVELVYDDQVSIIVGALDGRNAHLAEQVSAKSQVVMLSTQSSDPTLSRAYVPWYFRMVPDDRQQAEVLIRDMYELRKFKTIALVALDSYDGKKSVEALSAKAKDNGFPAATTLIDLSENELIQHIIKNPWEAVVLAGSATNTAQVIEKIRIARPEIKIYAFLNVFNFIKNFNSQTMEKIEFVRLVDFKDSNWLRFEQTFQTKYHTQPSPTLAYVYDGISLVTKSIITFGPDPEALKNGFKTMEYSGITGEIKFGKLGNRVNEWRLFE